MQPPICRVCRKAEWNHVCGSAVEEVREVVQPKPRKEVMPHKPETAPEVQAGTGVRRRGEYNATAPVKASDELQSVRSEQGASGISSLRTMPHGRSEGGSAHSVRSWAEAKREAGASRSDSPAIPQDDRARTVDPEALRGMRSRERSNPPRELQQPDRHQVAVSGLPHGSSSADKHATQSEVKAGADSTGGVVVVPTEVELGRMDADAFRKLYNVVMAELMRRRRAEKQKGMW
jgi:hypothetical protein